MKFFLQLILIFGLGYAAQTMLPWWSLVATATLLGLFFYYQRGGLAFLAGFLGMGLLWVVQIYYLQGLDQGAIAENMGELFSLSATGLIWVSALVAALLGGLGCWTGWVFRDLVSSTAQESA